MSFLFTVSTIGKMSLHTKLPSNTTLIRTWSYNELRNFSFVGNSPLSLLLEIDDRRKLVYLILEIP